MAVLYLARSEALRRLLSLLFADPAREYHLRHLERVIGMSLGAVQHVVGQLERAGIVKRRRLGNLALFSLNLQHPLVALHAQWHNSLHPVWQRTLPPEVNEVVSYRPRP